jgi:hypothetical protein
MTPFNSFIMAMHYRFGLAPTAQGFAMGVLEAVGEPITQ